MFWLALLWNLLALWLLWAYLPPAGSWSLAALLVLWAGHRLFGERYRLRRALRRVDRLDGREFEELLARIFRRRGWRVEITSGGKDFGADLILTKRRRRVAVQAKHLTSRNAGNEAVQQAIAGASYYECDRAMVVTTAQFTDSAVKQAERADIDVELLDMDDLRRMV